MYRCIYPAPFLLLFLYRVTILLCIAVSYQPYAVSRYCDDVSRYRTSPMPCHDTVGVYPGIRLYTMPSKPCRDTLTSSVTVLRPLSSGPDCRDEAGGQRQPHQPTAGAALELAKRLDRRPTRRRRRQVAAQTGGS